MSDSRSALVVDLGSTTARTKYDRSAVLRITGWALKSSAVMCLLTAEKVQRKNPPA